MAKKPLESMGMSDEDEFFESLTDEDNEDKDDKGEESSEEENEESDDSGESNDSGDEPDEGDGEGGKLDVGDGTEKEGEEGEKKEGGDSEASGTEGGEAEGETGDGEGEEEEDFFSDLEGKSEEGGEQPKAVDFKKLGSMLEIEIEDGQSEEQFAEKVRQRIEAAKQEVDLSKFAPQARRLVKHLNDNQGEITDFFTNPKISSYQQVLSMEPEDKLRMVRRSQFAGQGKSEEDIEAALDEELSGMSARQIMEVAEKINENARSLMAHEIEEIVGKTEKTVEENKKQEIEKINKQKEDLKDFVRNQNVFLGLNLSEKAKGGIIRDIESGVFDRTVDLTDAEIRFAAYMIKKSGKKMSDFISKKFSEKTREGYNNAVDKLKKKLHQSSDEAKTSKSGHQEPAGGKKNFDNWVGIE